MSRGPNRPLLLLAKRATRRDPQASGGVMVLVETLIRELEDIGPSFDIVDLNWRNYATPLHAYTAIIRRLLTCPGRYDHVSLHGTVREFSLLGALLCWRCGSDPNTGVSLRKFGGSFHRMMDRMSWPTRRCAEFALRSADHLFFETRYLTDHFSHYNPSTHRLPNSRPASRTHTDEVYRRRFVFASRVERNKGMDHLMEAFSRLDGGETLTVYGALSAEYSVSDVSGTNVEYGGALPPTELVTRLAAHDVLVLPTIWDTEGHPGVIIEALAAGLPVIATRVGGIPELIDEECGALVEPGDTEGLRKAISDMAHRDYGVLRRAALDRSARFDSRTVTAEFLRVAGIGGREADAPMEPRE